MKTIGQIEDPMGQAQPRALYVHVPFCAHRCGYCDFTLIAGRNDLVGDYLRMLELEIEHSEIPTQTSLDTIFFGGGTPTYPNIAELARLFQIVHGQFQTASGAEVSIEANPLDLTDDKIEFLVEAGVNRISLGVQSFSHQAIQLLERDHTPDDVANLMRRLKPYFDNISLDLIFGVPGQSLVDWRDTLRRAIEESPTHLSTYGLTFESGTSFWNRRSRGEMVPVDEELEREQYALAIDELSAAGYVQYEISNFAKPGYECRHNHVYWNGEEYWAFGPGAARYLKGRRETNIRSVLGWISRLERSESPVAENEFLDMHHRARELVYLGLRRNAGIARAEFHDRTGLDLDEEFGSTIRQQIQLGLLVDDGMAIKLTREGRFVGDRVVMEFL